MDHHWSPSLKVQGRYAFLNQYQNTLWLSSNNGWRTSCLKTMSVSQQNLHCILTLWPSKPVLMNSSTEALKHFCSLRVSAKYCKCKCRFSFLMILLSLSKLTVCFWSPSFSYLSVYLSELSPFFFGLFSLWLLTYLVVELGKWMTTSFTLQNFLSLWKNHLVLHGSYF